MRLENSFIFLDGIGEKTERRLWNRGMLNWDSFVAASAPLPHQSDPARIEDDLVEAMAALNDGDSTYFADKLPGRSRWRLYENFRLSTAFLDIETTGLDKRRNAVTTVSIHRDGATETLIRGRNLTDERLRTAIAGVPLVITFNGARFDIPFLEHEFDISFSMPHLDLLYPCRRVGLTGGLKSIERTLGIERKNDVDGYEAVRLWDQYERGEADALDRLVEYNQLDTVNLETLTSMLITRLDREVFGDHYQSKLSF